MTALTDLIEALSKAKTAVQRSSTDHHIAETAVQRAQDAEHDTASQLDAARSALTAATAQLRSANPGNDAQLQRLGNEKAIADARVLALEGQLDRELAVAVRARADLDTARAKLSQVQREHDAAQEKHNRALADAEEIRLVAAGDPSALSRKAERERAEAVRDEHLRIIRANSSFGVGGPAEVSIESEVARTRLSNKEAFAPGEHGWGVSSFERGRYSSPVGVRGNQEQTQVEGSKPYNVQDPLRNE